MVSYVFGEILWLSSLFFYFYYCNPIKSFFEISKKKKKKFKVLPVLDNNGDMKNANWLGFACIVIALILVCLVGTNYKRRAIDLGNSAIANETQAEDIPGVEKSTSKAVEIEFQSMSE